MFIYLFSLLVSLLFILAGKSNIHSNNDTDRTNTHCMPCKNIRTCRSTSSSTRNPHWKTSHDSKKDHSVCFLTQTLQGGHLPWAALSLTGEVKGHRETQQAWRRSTSEGYNVLWLTDEDTEEYLDCFQQILKHTHQSQWAHVLHFGRFKSPFNLVHILNLYYILEGNIVLYLSRLLLFNKVGWGSSSHTFLF